MGKSKISRLLKVHRKEFIRKYIYMHCPLKEVDADRCLCLVPFPQRLDKPNSCRCSAMPGSRSRWDRPPTTPCQLVWPRRSRAGPGLFFFFSLRFFSYIFVRPSERSFLSSQFALPVAPGPITIPCLELRGPRTLSNATHCTGPVWSQASRLPSSHSPFQLLQKHASVNQ